MWFGLSVPLVIVGSFLGFLSSAAPREHRSNQKARTIPEEARRILPAVRVLGGFLPFVCILAELVFILDDFNKGNFVYIYGGLAALFIMLLVTVAELSVIITYTGLLRGNWQWMWTSFGSSASTAFYVFAYAIYYLFRTPDGAPEGAALIAWMVYLSYMAIACGALGLMCGAVGFYASLCFVHVIYNRIRVE
jgi:transmembrane 9 superfamily protein 2/4